MLLLQSLWQGGGLGEYSALCVIQHMPLPKYLFLVLVLPSIHLLSSVCFTYMSLTHSDKMNRLKIWESVSAHPHDHQTATPALSSVHLVLVVFHRNNLCSKIKLHPHPCCYFSFTKTCWINRFLSASSIPSVFFNICLPELLLTFRIHQFQPWHLLCLL